MKKNSAHKDISILLDVNSPEYSELLRYLQKVPNGNSLQQVLEIIEQIEKESDIKANQFNHTVHLSNVDNQLEVLFKSVTFSGDTIHFPDPLKPHENETPITDEDIKALNEGRFEMDFYTPEDEIDYSLGDLLKDMQLYGIGRPSNFSKNINDLVDASLISISNGDITLTSLGMQVIDVLRKEEPTLCSPGFSNALNLMTEFIGSGHQNHSKLANELISKSFALSIDEKVFWSNEDEMYEAENSPDIQSGVVKKESR